jgi:hypothetical protein
VLEKKFYLYIKDITMVTMEKSSVINDFKWVIKLLDSSESEEQMDTTLKCFNLWENKHVDKSPNTKDKKIICELRSSFWSKFKNKISNIGTFNI